MNESKAEMYGSYLALFWFASAMVLFRLYLNSKVGPVLWGLVAWQIYRRDKLTLIITLKLLFWLVIAIGIGSIIWLVLDPPNADLRPFVEEEGIGLAITAGLFWWMRFHFEKSPTAADIFDNSNAGTQAPAGAGIATAETLSPRPKAENLRARVFAVAKQVIPWRRRPEQPAFAADPAATAGDVAGRGSMPPAIPRVSPQTDFDRSVVPKTAATARIASTIAGAGRIPGAAVEPTKAAQHAAPVAAKTADTAPPSPAVPSPVAVSPGIKAATGDLPKAAPPEIHSTSPLQAVLDEERVYAAIAHELETGGIDKGLWTRLFAECDGDDRRTKVLYIRQRAERLISAQSRNHP